MQFPVTSGQPALSLTNLLTTLLAIKLARLWTSAAASSSVHTLYDVIGGVLSGGLVDAPSAQTALATITGWPLADIESFSAALGWCIRRATRRRRHTMRCACWKRCRRRWMPRVR